MDLFEDIEDPSLAVSASTKLSPLLEGMNEGQVQAILHKEGPALVVAGAGSGKTTVMTRRVAALIESGVNPSEIMLLTFTKAAAKSMIDRARRYSPYADLITSGTFHAVAHRLIMENKHLFKFPSVPTIIDPSDTVSTFKSIVKRLGSKDENLPTAETIADVRSFCVNTLREIEDVVYDKYEQFAHAVDFFTECINAYKEFKKANSLLDFDDLLVVWSKMLDVPEIAQAMARRFRFIMVDEYQDTNALQFQIVRKLASVSTNVMVVGDPAQAIYGWRGASPGTMFALLELWPTTNVIYLNTNYRSTEEVISLGNAVDLSMRDRFDRQLNAVPGTQGETPKIVSVPSSQSEAEFVATKVLENKSDGIELHEQAVLVRSLHVARTIELEFNRRKIPYRVVGGIKISEARHIKEFLSLARCSVNHLDEPAWIKAFCMAKSVGPAMAEKLMAIVRAGVAKGEVNCAQVVSKSKDNPDIAAIMDAWSVLASCKGKPTSALDHALILLNDIFLARFPDDWKKSRKQDVETVIAMAEQYADMESYLTTLTLDHSVEKGSSGEADDNAERPITISTAHSAKGLEWDAVFIPGFVQGHMPSAFARDPESVEEEKRVLYVAVTRPRKQLTISIPSFMQTGRAETSRFLEIIEPFCVKERWGQMVQSGNYSFGSDFSIDPFD